MKRNVMIPAILVAAGLSTAAGLVLARQTTGAGNDAVLDLGRAKVSLTQAVGTAETQVGGRATKAELDSEDGAVAFHVEVVAADSKVFDVKVDATDGKVLSSRPDGADRDDHEDHED